MLPGAPDPVTGGDHAAVLLDREASGGELDAVDVTAQPGAAAQPHRHAFGEWLRVLRGEVTLLEERDGVVRAARVLEAGETAWIAPGAVHATANHCDTVAVFQLVGRPAVLTGYLRDAAGGDHDAAAARWGIEPWTGPVDGTPLEG